MRAIQKMILVLGLIVVISIFATAPTLYFHTSGRPLGYVPAFKSGYIARPDYNYIGIWGGLTSIVTGVLFAITGRKGD